MSEGGWYLAAALLIVGLAGVQAAVDAWLLGQERPYSGRFWTVLLARWGFIMTIPIYAWLIDSHRVPYQEPGVWGLFMAGVGGTLLLGLWLRRRGR